MQVVEALRGALSERQVSIADVDRRAVSTDQWPLGLLQYRQRVAPALPLCVVSPETLQEVVRTVNIAREHGLGIVPYGAGSGVVGGAWAEEGAITLDFKRMRRVLRLDQDRLFADVEAGIIGIHLENHLRRHGLTLGHFPSSIICSSLGGWVVGRSAGQFSSRYGKIEDMVLSLRAVDGRGEVRVLESDPLPAAGPDELQMFIGSEGMLGLVCDARLRVWPKPEAELYWGFEVSGVGHGLEVMRTLLREGYAPTVLRLYDEFDSLVASRKADGSKAHDVASEHATRRFARERHDTLPRLPKRILSALKRRSLAMALLNPTAMRFGVDRLPPRCLLIVGCEGKEDLAQRMMEGMRAHCARQGARDLGAGPGLAWYHGRYHVSYKQSPVFVLGAWVDTMEVSAPWQEVERIYDAVRDAVRDRAFVMAHFSHAYLDGCALYFTFAGMETQDDVSQYLETWRRALAAVVENGGSVSHHHGVGLAKYDFLAGHHGPLWSAYRALAARWDPDRIFNRGKWQ